MRAFWTKPTFNRVEFYGFSIWLIGTRDLPIADKLAWFFAYVILCLVAEISARSRP